MRYVVLCLLGVGLLAGCASSDAPRVDRLTALRHFTVTDLSTARDIAVAGGDRAGAMCLTYLAAKATALAAQPVLPATPPDPALPLAHLERIRVAIHTRSTGPSFLEDLDLNCAALRTSLEIDLAKGAMLVSGVVGSGGASAPGAIAKVLPILMRLLRPGG